MVFPAKNFGFLFVQLIFQSLANRYMYEIQFNFSLFFFAFDTNKVVIVIAFFFVYYRVREPYEWEGVCQGGMHQLPSLPIIHLYLYL